MRRIMVVCIFAVLFSLAPVLAQGVNDTGVIQDPVGVFEPTVCCEQTTDGLSCVDVPESRCAENATKAPTSCASTAFCRTGTCFSSTEGTCLDSPKLVCEDNGGAWSQDSPPQCELGCCILGDQAAFVTLVRCKRLASTFGLPINYNRDVSDELSCVLSTGDQVKGACVFESEFERTCKAATRSECEVMGESEFFEGRLCTAEELGTNCAPTTKTTCVDGRDGAYFLDSCGNIANIYDAKAVDPRSAQQKAYWTFIEGKEDSCNPGNDNANDPGCGNCDYALGSVCREHEGRIGGPTFGSAICRSLNCEDIGRKHGESWCTTAEDAEVGSRYFKHICINGEDVLEPCADFRQEVCIEDTVGDFTNAACRKNRWHDCTDQSRKSDCEDTVQRDCRWTGTDLVVKDATFITGRCFPKVIPGLKFWEGDDAKTTCAFSNGECLVEKEKKIGGGWKVVENNDCLLDFDDSGWKQKLAASCSAVADCGTKVNWLGKRGRGDGFIITSNTSEKGSDFSL